MNVEEALKKLNDAHLVAEFVGGSDKRIIGGTERSNELGFNVYSDSFAIYREGDTWLVAITGPGHLDTTRQTATLAEAISQTCQLYEAQTAKIAP